MIAGCRVHAFTDNVGGECALKAGAARCEDHNMIVHAIWAFAAKQKLPIWFDRVRSKDNLADEPSRQAALVGTSLRESVHHCAPCLQGIR